MPARYIVGQPTRHRGPLPEHEGETVFDWLRRQNRPVKPATRKTSPTRTTFESALDEMVQQKKKDATGGNRSRPTDPQEEGSIS
jgi:protein subunit release factor B